MRREACDIGEKEALVTRKRTGESGELDRFSSWKRETRSWLSGLGDYLGWVGVDNGTVPKDWEYLA